MTRINKFTNSKSDRPQVSILMTVFNAEDYIIEAINSLINQTYTNWELIIVDDGSTDSSLTKIKIFIDYRIRIFPLERNIGRTSALRLAFELATGSYIAVLDADDVSDPNRIFEQVNYLDNHMDIALVASWVYYIDENSRIFDELTPPTSTNDLYDCLGWTNPIAHSSAMYRFNAAKDVGGYPTDLYWAQDFGLILNLANRHGIAMIGKHLCKIRLLTNSMTRSKKNRLIVAMEEKKLFTLAANTLNLSGKSIKLNHYAISAAEIKLGICGLNTSFAHSVKIILANLFKSPLVLLNNGFIRKKLFGSKY